MPNACHDKHIEIAIILKLYTSESKGDYTNDDKDIIYMKPKKVSIKSKEEEKKK